MKPSQQIAEEMAKEHDLTNSQVSGIALTELIEVAMAAQREVNAYKSCMSPIPTSIQHLEEAIESLTKKGFSFE